MFLLLTEGADKERAEALSQKFNLKLQSAQAETGSDKQESKELNESEVLDAPENPEGPEELHLELTPQGLFLKQGALSLQGDFKTLMPRVIKKRLDSELLLKAARLKDQKEGAVLLDATAGLGEDSFLLAAGGFEVYLFELDPVIAALLEDAILRGLQDPELKPIVSRMHLIPGDSILAMKGLSHVQKGAVEEIQEALSGYENSIGSRQNTAALLPPVDVIYLDPMFPERTKSGLIKKKFQLLHGLEAPCSSEEELLQAAIAADPKKILIKRPLKGPDLAGMKPDYTLSGKAIRFDVLVNVANRQKKETLKNP